jgi:hypothetical protein
MIFKFCLLNHLFFDGPYPLPKAHIWNLAQHLQPFFDGGKKHGNWRSSKDFFKSDEDCVGSTPGSINISPGWFEQAQDVSMN